ncbi:MAG: DUF1365 domain-containing protein [Alphaproteobacteria bacterium]|nr:DUF1365 domain-containing protein [Alphaproteobacteria bacterium SS10]
MMHKRLVPFQHRFDYRVFSLWLDMDRLEETAGGLRSLSLNRFNLFSFHDVDHGARDGSSVQMWLRDMLDGWSLLPAKAKIMAQCYPRLFGYVFNPLTVFYVYDLADPERPSLSTIVYEVKNTFGDQHCYVIPVDDNQRDRGIVTQQADKGLYVSPFLPLAGHYRFRMNRPGETLSQLIRQSGATTGEHREQLIASFNAKRHALTDANLLKAMATHPLMTAKVMAGIHWEALKIWRKGAKFHSRPKPPALPATLIRPATQSSGHPVIQDTDLPSSVVAAE